MEYSTSYSSPPKYYTVCCHQVVVTAAWNEQSHCLNFEKHGLSEIQLSTLAYYIHKNNFTRRKN